MRKFVKHFAEKVGSLSHEEELLIRISLQNVDDLHKTRELIEKQLDFKRSCPHCKSLKVYRHGIASGLQRYRCQTCKKTFNALTKTPLSRLRNKDKWLAHIALMNKSVVLRKTASELGISLPTAFRWRHRFCSWMKQQDDAVMAGIIEANTTFLSRSEKGTKQLKRSPRKRGATIKMNETTRDQVCIFTAADRAHNSLETISGLGPVSAEWLIKQFVPCIASDAVLVSNNLTPYQKMITAKKLGQIVMKKSTQRETQKAFHTEYITALDTRIKEWINGHFRGVATKYLQHYLGWRHLLEGENPNNIEQTFESILRKPNQQLT